MKLPYHCRMMIWVNKLHRFYLASSSDLKRYGISTLLSYKLKRSLEIKISKGSFEGLTSRYGGFEYLLTVLQSS